MSIEEEEEEAYKNKQQIQLVLFLIAFFLLLLSPYGRACSRKKEAFQRKLRPHSSSERLIS